MPNLSVFNEFMLHPLYMICKSDLDQICKNEFVKLFSNLETLESHGVLRIIQFDDVHALRAYW